MKKSIILCCIGIIAMILCSEKVQAAEEKSINIYGPAIQTDIKEFMDKNRESYEKLFSEYVKGETEKLMAYNWRNLKLGQPITIYSEAGGKIEDKAIGIIPVYEGNTIRFTLRIQWKMGTPFENSRYYQDTMDEGAYFVEVLNRLYSNYIEIAECRLVARLDGDVYAINDSREINLSRNKEITTTENTNWSIGDREELLKQIKEQNVSENIAQMEEYPLDSKEASLNLVGVRLSERVIQDIRETATVFLGDIGDNSNQYSTVEIENSQSLVLGYPITTFCVQEDNHIAFDYLRCWIPFYEGQKVSAMLYYTDPLEGYKSGMGATDEFMQELMYLAENYKELGTCYLLSKEGNIYAVSSDRVINLTEEKELTGDEIITSLGDPKRFLAEIEETFGDKKEYVGYSQLFSEGIANIDWRNLEDEFDVEEYESGEGKETDETKIGMKMLNWKYAAITIVLCAASSGATYLVMKKRPRI